MGTAIANPIEMDGAYIPPERVVVASIYPRDKVVTISRRAPVSKFVVPRGTPEKPGLLVVEDTWESEYAGEQRGNVNRRILAQHTARHVVEDVTIHLFMANAQERAYPGIFVCAAETPSQSEIQEAEETQRRYWMRLVNAAREMERNNRRQDVQDEHRLAGQELGIQGEPWQLDISKDSKKKCVWCSEFIDNTARRCPKCSGFQSEKDAQDFLAMNATPVPMVPTIPVPPVLDKHTPK